MEETKDECATTEVAESEQTTGQTAQLHGDAMAVVMAHALEAIKPKEHDTIEERKDAMLDVVRYCKRNKIELAAEQITSMTCCMLTGHCLPACYTPPLA